MNYMSHVVIYALKTCTYLQKAGNMARPASPDELVQ